MDLVMGELGPWIELFEMRELSWREEDPGWSVYGWDVEAILAGEMGESRTSEVADRSGPQSKCICGIV